VTVSSPISRAIRACVFGLIAFGLPPASHAVPAFARQTDLDCTACHVSWPELTPTGRQFKLNGYTLGDRQSVPLAGMLQISRTSTKSVDPSAPDQFPKDRDVVVQQASLFAAGKITDHLGAFTQWTYDGVAHHSSIDNVDIRYALHFGEGDHKLITGVTLNNNPTVQDVYNTVPAWGFPFASSPVAVAPNASTIIDGALSQQVAGLGVYALWNNLVYGEITAYRTADKALSILRAGVPRDEAAALDGSNPYWRLALQREWAEGKHSAMVGTYGTTVDKFPDNTNPTGLTDRFRDIAFDAQYQYVTDAHRFSAQLNWIHEKQDWRASFPAGDTSNPTDTLKSFRAKATYYYQKKYGVTLSAFSTRGDSDDALYNSGDPITGSASGSPNTSGYIIELNYLPKRDIRLALQYTAYARFNGAASNYDGAGRDARANDALYLLGWFMF
jgi:hypothetical protein